MYGETDTNENFTFQLKYQNVQTDPDSLANAMIIIHIILTAQNTPSRGFNIMTPFISTHPLHGIFW